MLIVLGAALRLADAGGGADDDLQRDPNGIDNDCDVDKKEGWSRRPVAERMTDLGPELYSAFLETDNADNMVVKRIEGEEYK